VLFVHFHAFPLQDHTTIDKARALAQVLTRYQFASRLLLVPFATVQQTIVAGAPAPLRVVLYRRFMVRIAEALAARHKAKALVTGESLGQVASQTLDNMGSARCPTRIAASSSCRAARPPPPAWKTCAGPRRAWTGRRWSRPPCGARKRSGSPSRRWCRRPPRYNPGHPELPLAREPYTQPVSRDR
jgi:hypothetical protein